MDVGDRARALGFALGPERGITQGHAEKCLGLRWSWGGC